MNKSNIITKISEWKRTADKHVGALNAIAVIVEMDPGVRQDLITYLQALNETQTKDEREYVLKAILELFNIDGNENAMDIQDWEHEVSSLADGQDAARKLREETERFFRSYQRLKARTGLRTIRQVAQAAGISPTTVQAVEKQRVKPQFRTVQALAKAFDVDPVALGNGTI